MSGQVVARNQGCSPLTMAALAVMYDDWQDAQLHKSKAKAATSIDRHVKLDYCSRDGSAGLSLKKGLCHGRAAVIVFVKQRILATVS